VVVVQETKLLKCREDTHLSGNRQVL